jgi:hypothetical protein
VGALSLEREVVHRQGTFRDPDPRCQGEFETDPPNYL